MSKIILIIFVVIATSLLIACKRQDIVYDVIDAPVVTTSKNYTVEQMRNAIIRAGQSLGWRVQNSGKQRLRATLFVRDHMAQVMINYNWRAYSIRYENSRNLEYEGDSIHRNYNSWVRNLDNRIQSELSLL